MSALPDKGNVGMSEPRCEACRFWGEIKEVDAQHTVFLLPGICRRFPPVLYVFSAPGREPWDWPRTQADDWCGEFQPAPDEDERMR